ncbi:MAG: hypothetical protein HMLKMBBP_01244 [Planctomycetes bacterium]|nr:hypothetical protein [Planctomycetota bacterium]
MKSAWFGLAVALCVVFGLVVTRCSQLERVATVSGTETELSEGAASSEASAGPQDARRNRGGVSEQRGRPRLSSTLHSVSVCGRVVASGDRSEVVGARVALIGLSSLQTAVLTDLTGRFEISNVESGAEVAITIEHESCETRTVARVLTEEPMVDIGDVELVPLGAARFSVRSQAANLGTDWSVQVHDDSGTEVASVQLYPNRPSASVLTGAAARLRCGEFTAQARGGPGWAAAPTRFVVRPFETAEVNLSALAGVMAVFRLRDQSGGVVSGAALQARPYGMRGSSDEAVSPLGITAADGTVAVAAMRPGRYTAFAMIGTRRVVCGEFSVPAHATIELATEASALLRVRMVWDDSGEPLRSATVTGRTGGTEATAATGPDGIVELDAPAGAVFHELRVMLPEGLSIDCTAGAESGMLVGRAQPMRPVEVRVRRPASLCVSVVHRGIPVANTRVRCRWVSTAPGGGLAHAVTNEQGIAMLLHDSGSVVFLDIDDGEWCVERPSAVVAGEPWFGAAVIRVECRGVAGEIAAIPVVPALDCAVRGRTIGADGVGVPGLTVVLDGVHTVSGPDGSFDLRGVRAARGAVIGAYHSGLCVGLRELVQNDVGANLVESVVIQVQPIVSVGVEVAGSDGRPVPGAVLQLAPSGVSQPVNWLGYPSVATGPDGKLSLTDVRDSGSRWVLVSAPGYSSRVVTLASPRPSVVRIELQTSKLTTVHILSEDGQPIRSGGVRVRSAKDLARRVIAEVRADPSGVATIEALNDADVLYEAWASGHVSFVTRVGESLPTRVVLGAGTSLIGLVIDSDGQPQAGAHVVATTVDREGLRWVAASDSSGQFSIADLPLGPIMLSVTSLRTPPDFASTRVEVGTDRSAREIVVRRTRAIAGRVEIAGGLGLGGVKIRAHCIDRGFTEDRVVVTSDAGEFEVGGLLGSRYELQVVGEAQPPGDNRSFVACSPSWRSPIVPTEAGDRDVVLRLEQECVVVHVRGGSDPLPGAIVAFFTENHVLIRTVRTSPSGLAVLLIKGESEVVVTVARDGEHQTDGARSRVASESDRVVRINVQIDPK